MGDHSRFPIACLVRDSIKNMDLNIDVHLYGSDNYLEINVADRVVDCGHAWYYPKHVSFTVCYSDPEFMGRIINFLVLGSYYGF